ncbi:MAG TPA: hypothetical protein VMA35_06315 [Candidatus Sulfopaludibacter sp.]|nr:hypothetical protein [Candidatus Sulfopaludibacter sp.]
MNRKSLPPFADDFVCGAEHDGARPPFVRLLFAQSGEAHDGQQIALFAKAGGGAFEHNPAGTTLARNDMRFEPVAVGRVTAQDALLRTQAGGLHQIGGDGEAAFVIHIAISNGGAMNFRFEQEFVHEPPSMAHRATTST